MTPDCKEVLKLIENENLSKYSKEELDKFLDVISECGSQTNGQQRETIVNAINKINKILKEK
jgi:hypothetical protein